MCAEYMLLILRVEAKYDRTSEACDDPLFDELSSKIFPFTLFNVWFFQVGVGL